MQEIWKKILASASDLLPNFNNHLLLEFRNNKIKQITNYLDSLFTESVKIFNGKLQYTGWQELTPDERLEYIKENSITKKKIEIQNSSFELLRFNFELDNVVYPVYLHVPFMDHGAIIYQDTKYFPLFPIIERGGLHRTNHDVIIKVMRAPLIFKRCESYTFVTNKLDRSYKEIVVTVKIHQRKKGRGGKHSDRTPLIIYHLVKYPFYEVTRLYGFNPGDLTFVNEIPEKDEDFQYVKIKDNINLKVANTALSDPFKRRFIASLLMCLEEYPRFDIRDLTANDAHYYKTVLGKFTYPTANNGALLYENAVKHLETTDTLLDPPAQYQLSQIGINVSNIYELLLVIFFNIDNWIVGYDPTNLYEKKIGSLDQIMAPVVSAVNSKLFKIINNKRVGLNAETLKEFTKSISLHANWITGNTTFRANPAICNDNWLIAIGAHKFRSLENTETKSNNKGGHNLPKALLKAHPSQLVVESILNYPPSNPIVGGCINPYLQIDNDGNIIKPEWADEISHVFD